MAEPAFIPRGSAVIDGPYRYSLVRQLKRNSYTRIAWIMLNPSTADAKHDDPTLRRCVGFSKRWGFGSLEVVNLFGFRTTKPTDLRRVLDPVGPRNDEFIVAAVTAADCVVCAWGGRALAAGWGKRSDDVNALIREVGSVVFCLRTTKGGDPSHPLYVRADQGLTPFPIPSGGDAH